MSQGKRNSTLKKFQDGDLKILVTTDVAARGLNMDNVGLVVNFDVPKESESYIHRIGRTGRAGAHGKAIMLVAPEEGKLFSDIERTHKTRIPKSDHVVEQDKESEFIKYRLDKSTDKFGKGRMNPNQPRRTFNGGGKSSFDGPRAPRPDRPKKTYGKPFVKEGFKAREDSRGPRDARASRPFGKQPNNTPHTRAALKAPGQKSYISQVREKYDRDEKRGPRNDSRFTRPSGRPERPAFGAKTPFR